ncbi:MAG: D-alanine--D-alanine ligase [Gaiellales bacterium]|nr:D-alanine--D-alanine ligase [Gaiellales bacterium]
MARFRDKKIGVLLGGLSSEREVSLRSGANCLQALRRLGYEAVGVDVGRDVACRLRESQVDVAFLALHGRYGEDGTVQGLLEMLAVPYTGSGVLASALAMHKVACKKVCRQSGVPTPDWIDYRRGDDVEAIARRCGAGIGLPVIVKPVQEGSSVGVAKVTVPEELPGVLREAADCFGSIMIERFVPGKEITVGVVEGADGVISLPILELVPKNEFYDYEAKYTHGMTEFIIPARLESATYAAAGEYACLAFQAVGCRGYARVDFMVDEEGVPQFTEVNTLPGMTDLSDLPAQARHAGISYDELVEMILDTAALDADFLGGPSAET